MKMVCRFCGGKYQLKQTDTGNSYYECESCGESTPKRITPVIAGKLLEIMELPKETAKLLYPCSGEIKLSKEETDELSGVVDHEK